MRINFEDPTKVGLTLPKHELRYVSIWNTYSDAAYLRVDDKDYLYFEGVYYNGCVDPAMIWHPGQLIISMSWIAKTKARKLVREQCANHYVACDSPCPEPEPVVFPDHLTLSKGERKWVTGFHDSADIIAFNRNGDHVLRIGGSEYMVSEDRQGAAGYIDWWDKLPEGELMREIAKFTKFATKF